MKSATVTTAPVSLPRHAAGVTRRWPALLLLAAVALVCALPGAAQTPYKKLKYPPLKDLTLPQVERVELPNGLVLYLVEDRTLPKVEGYALIRTGTRFEPAEKTGLADVLGEAMRTGGTRSRKGEEIDRLLENVGASVETGLSAAAGTASIFTLKEHLPLTLEILADLLRDPAFPDDKIELAMVQQRTAIARRNDDVGGIAAREFVKLIYGADSPYARHPEYETLQNITRDDLVAFHRRYFQPSNVILGLWGDFDKAEVKKLVEQHFGSWPRQEVEVPPAPEAKAGAAPGVYFIQKDDVNQTNLRLGHLGGRFDDPDFYALNVMSEILGGGFTSRLFRRVRSDLGLAYAVGAGWGAQYDYPGAFSVRCDTKSETTVKAAQEILKELRRITEEPVTADELKVAKESILNSFVFNFDTTGEIVRRLMIYEYYGYPRDFLDKFKINIEKVTADDVLRAARANVKPDNLVILAVGRQQDFDQPLTALGEVKSIDITIPEPKAAVAAVPPATGETLARGRLLIEKAAVARGGLETLQSVRDLTVLSRVLQETPAGAMNLTIKVAFVPPDKLRQDIVTPVGEFIVVLDGESGWQKGPQGTAPASPPLVRALRTVLARNLESLLPRVLAGEATAQFLATETHDGRPADAVLVTDAAGQAVRMWVDQETGYVVKQAYQGEAPQGPVAEERVFSDFRTVNGLVFPHKTVVFQDGRQTSEATVVHIEINAGVDPALFVPPGP
ncbi:MAG: insulinase family protein [Candidatus Acidiferrales bacterium]